MKEAFLIWGVNRQPIW